jgi:hypothetical protein
MSETRLLRLAIWASVALAALFQTAFLFELHSPSPSDMTLWSLSIVSFLCVVVVLLARRSLATKEKIGYRRERVYLERHSHIGGEYRVQGVYCVILRRERPFLIRDPSVKCFYLSEGSADGAVTTALIENPTWQAIGVEPPTLSARMPQSGCSQPTSHTWHVA